MEKIGESVKIKKIAITGIVASGKSSVCDILASHGAYVIKSDEIVHRLYSQNHEVQKKLVAKFGKIILSQGKIDRHKLGQIVFSDKTALTTLEEFIHPYVIQTIKETYNQVKDQHYCAFVVEFPLLFEIGLDSWFDKNATVVSRESDCQERFDAIFGNGEFDKRMSSQWTQREKIARSDVIIENKGSLQELKTQALKCLV